MKTKSYLLGKRRVKVMQQDNLIGIDTVTKTVDTVKNLAGYTTDATLIRTRDAIYAIFKSFGMGPGTKALDAAAIKNKMSHAEIPNRKVGGNYDSEFARLYQLVIDTLNNAGRDDLAEIWQRTVPVFTAKDHDFSYLRDLLNGKIRAIPTQPTAQDIASDMANTAIAETAMQQRGFNPAPVQSESTKALVPFAPIMRAGVSAAGYVPPSSINDLALIFYEKVVKPGTQSTYDNDFLDEAIVDSILHFIATLQAKHAAGEEMNKTYTLIAEKTTQLQNKGVEIAREQAGNKVGGFVVDNVMIIGLILAVIIIMLVAKK